MTSLEQSMLTVNDMTGLALEVTSRVVSDIVAEVYAHNGDRVQLFIAGTPDSLSPTTTVDPSVTTLFAMPLPETALIVIRSSQTAEYDRGSETRVCHEFSLVDGDQMHSFANDFGPCCSGYTTATTGDYTNRECDFHTETTGNNDADTLVIPFLKSCDITVTDDEDEFKAFVDGQTIIRGETTGGDNYYPCGGAYLDMSSIKDYISETSYEALVTFIDSE